MTAILGILAGIGFIAGLGAVSDWLNKRRRRTLVPSDAERTRAQQTLDYYAKVRDSSNQ